MQRGVVYSKDMVKYSIVVPFHNEEENVAVLYARLKQVMEQVGESYELVLVDDGSSDRTYKLMREIAAIDSRVLVIKLRRNFGQTSALAAGFEKSGRSCEVTGWDEGTLFTARLSSLVGGADTLHTEHAPEFPRTAHSQVQSFSLLTCDREVLLLRIHTFPVRGFPAQMELSKVLSQLITVPRHYLCS